MGVAAKLGLHAYHQIEKLLPLDHLGDRLASHSRRDHGFHVGYVNSVARNLVAIHIEQQAGLAQFAHHGQFLEARNSGQHVLHLHRFVLQHGQVGAINFDGERTLQPVSASSTASSAGWVKLKMIPGKALNFLLSDAISSSFVLTSPSRLESLYGFRPT